MGNLGSVQNMLKRMGVQSIISGDPDIISKAAKIILPGVGAFDTAVEKISNTGIIDVLNEKALREKIPVLGICLGMQLLTEASEEGVQKGLGWIPAKTVRFNVSGLGLKVPHMGWNYVYAPVQHSITAGFESETRFYFVHAYHVKVFDKKYTLAHTTYGYEFDSIITNGDNIFGAQFHPEKSHRFGINFLENFAKL